MDELKAWVCSSCKDSCRLTISADDGQPRACVFDLTGDIRCKWYEDATRTPELPDPCTVEQYQEIKGKAFPVGGMIFIKDDDYGYFPETYNPKIAGLDECYIVQTGKPAPKD